MQSNKCDARKKIYQKLRQQLKRKYIETSTYITTPISKNRQKKKFSRKHIKKNQSYRKPIKRQKKKILTKRKKKPKKHKKIIIKTNFKGRKKRGFSPKMRTCKANLF